MFSITPGILRVVSSLQPDPATIMIGGKLSSTTPDTDVGIVAWYTSELSKWIMIDKATQTYPFDYAITFHGDVLKPIGASVHGAPAWVGSTYCIYRSPQAGIVTYLARSNTDLGKFKPPDDSETFAFWTMAGSAVHAATFVPKGTATGSYTTDTDNWARWESDTQFGKYVAKAQGGVGDKVVGLPQWTSAGFKTYTRSLGTFPPTKYNSFLDNGDGTFGGWVFGKYTYGAIHFDSSVNRWVIGTPNTLGGWWECEEEPSPGHGSTFVFFKFEEDDAVGSNILLVWDKYVAGDNTGAVYTGEAAIWRI